MSNQQYSDLESSQNNEEKLEFCRNVYEVAKSDGPCGPYLAQIKKEREIENDIPRRKAEQLSRIDLVGKCKQFISNTMGQATSIMDTDSLSPDGASVRISYSRPGESKIWKYECKIFDDSLVWRGIDIFSEGEGPGRWRHEDSVPLSSL